jgi:hypothetical protein
LKLLNKKKFKDEKGDQKRLFETQKEAQETRMSVPAPPSMSPEEFEVLLDQAENGNLNVVESALALRPALANRMNSDGWTLLMRAALEGRLEVTRFLLDRGASLLLRHNKGWDVLTFACGRNNKEVVMLLLDRGADPNARFSLTTATALGRASFRDLFDICLLLIQRGADLFAALADRTALDDYGIGVGLDANTIEERCKALREAFAAGPHPSQVQRRRDEAWARRWPFVSVLVCYGLQPLAYRKALMQAAALPHDAVIPAIPHLTRAQYHRMMIGAIFGHDSIWRVVASFM